MAVHVFATFFLLAVRFCKLNQAAYSGCGAATSIHEGLLDCVKRKHLVQRHVSRMRTHGWSMATRRPFRLFALTTVVLYISVTP
eukprot:813571-Pleurochrysis_carterae.AAC.1